MFVFISLLAAAIACDSANERGRREWKGKQDSLHKPWRSAITLVDYLHRADRVLDAVHGELCLLHIELLLIKLLTLALKHSFLLQNLGVHGERWHGSHARMIRSHHHAWRALRLIASCAGPGLVFLICSLYLTSCSSSFLIWSSILQARGPWRKRKSQGSRLD